MTYKVNLNQKEKDLFDVCVDYVFNKDTITPLYKWYVKYKANSEFSEEDFLNSKVIQVNFIETCMKLYSKFVTQDIFIYQVSKSYEFEGPVYKFWVNLIGIINPDRVHPIVFS